MPDPQWITNQSLLNNDPEYDMIEVRVRRRSDLPAETKLTSWGLERAVIEWMHSHFSTWTKYIVENGMKTLN